MFSGEDTLEYRFLGEMKKEIKSAVLTSLEAYHAILDEIRSNLRLNSLCLARIKDSPFSVICVRDNVLKNIIEAFFVVDDLVTYFSEERRMIDVLADNGDDTASENGRTVSIDILQDIGFIELIIDSVNV